MAHRGGLWVWALSCSAWLPGVACSSSGDAGSSTVDAGGPDGSAAAGGHGASAGGSGGAAGGTSNGGSGGALAPDGATGAGAADAGTGSGGSSPDGAVGIGGTTGDASTGGGAGTGGAPTTGGVTGTGGAPATGGNTGTGGATGGGAAPSCTAPAWNANDFTTVLDVGPGQALATPSDVPWESIGPGTLVRIHARPTAYHDKWVLNVAGTEAAPVVVLGVPDASGNLPALRGDGAVTRRAINFWGEERSIIKIGGSNTPANATPSYVHVECLDIAGARAGSTFTDDGGNTVSYATNAATITIESGNHVTIRNNVLGDSGNGLFAAHDSTDVQVIGNTIQGNGNVGSIYEHNSYTESFGILFEGNHYGPLCSGCLGNNLKDRSAGTVIRYNWIESGNRQLDLVDSDYASLFDDPSYRTTFVYGNVLVEPDGAGNSQIIHYGGDSGTLAQYRKGTLHLFHNTVVSTRAGNTTLVRLSSPEESMDARDNVFYASAGGSSFGIVDADGTATLEDNFLQTGWQDSHGTLTGTVTDLGNVTGTSPGFVDLATQDFHLSASSPCIGAAGPLAAAAAAFPVNLEIATPTVLSARTSRANLGAFE